MFSEKNDKVKGSDFETESLARYDEIVTLLNNHNIPFDAVTGRVLHQLAFVTANRLFGLDVARKMFGGNEHNLA